LREVARKLIAAGVSSIPLKDPSLVDPAVLAMWQQGRQLSAAEYVNTVAKMHNTSRELVRELLPFDALLTPTLTRPAVPLGSFTNPDTFGDDLFAWAAFTFPFNATGQPALSLPNGFSRDGLPLALQIVGRPADEEGLLAIGAAFEEARPWRGQHPPLT
jgi:amidase